MSTIFHYNNNNPNAPIFRHADRGIVADYAEAVPLLAAALGRRGGAGEGASG
jgi:electron transfer flavoprotein alpha subunit